MITNQIRFELGSLEGKSFFKIKLKSKKSKKKKMDKIMEEEKKDKSNLTKRRRTRACERQELLKKKDINFKIKLNSDAIDTTLSAIMKNHAKIASNQKQSAWKEKNKKNQKMRRIIEK